MGQAEVVADLVQPADTVVRNPLVVDEDRIQGAELVVDREGVSASDSRSHAVHDVDVHLVLAPEEFAPVRLCGIFEGHHFGGSGREESREESEEEGAQAKALVASRGQHVSVSERGLRWVSR